MAVTTETCATSYLGNASTVDTYPVTWPFLDPTHIKVAVRDLDDEDATLVVLSPIQYDVLTNGGNPRVRCKTAWPATHEVVVFRQTPRVQPTVYPTSGPFPAKSHETGLDRATMIAQETARDAGLGGVAIPMPPQDGKSAYEVAVENGFEGTEEDWLASLVGPPGPSGGGSWGTIEGELSDQTDLANAFAGKAASDHTHAASAVTFTPAGGLESTDVQAAIEEAAASGGGGFPAYKAKVLAMGPVAYLPLDETSGTSFADATGNGHDGTSSGSVTPNQLAAIIGSDGKAPLFTTNGYIAIPAHVDLAFTPNTDPFSVSLWQRTSVANTATLIGKTGGGTNRNFQIFNQSAIQGINVHCGGAATGPITLDGFRNGLWHHLAITSDATTVRIWYDGREVHTFSPGSFNENNLDWTIGIRRSGGENVNTGTSGPWDGNLAHVALFNRELSVQEVGSLSHGRDVW